MSVIFKKWQFSSLTAPGDSNLVRWPATTDKSWQDSLLQAETALLGLIKNPVSGADSYYDISIKPPAWTAAPARKVKQIGRLVFYDVSRDWEADQLKQYHSPSSPSNRSE